MWWSFRVFNITNPDEVQGGDKSNNSFFFFQLTKTFFKGQKPNVVEMGPYTYRVYKRRFNVSFPDEGDTFCYRTWLYFVFDQV